MNIKQALRNRNRLSNKRAIIGPVSHRKAAKCIMWHHQYIECLIPGITPASKERKALKAREYHYKRICRESEARVANSILNKWVEHSKK